MHIALFYAFSSTLAPSIASLLLLLSVALLLIGVCVIWSKHAAMLACAYFLLFFCSYLMPSMNDSGLREGYRLVVTFPWSYILMRYFGGEIGSQVYTSAEWAWLCAMVNTAVVYLVMAVKERYANHENGGLCCINQEEDELRSE